MYQWSEGEIKISMMNVLRAFMESRKHARTKRQCKLRDGYSKKGSKQNARN